MCVAHAVMLKQGEVTQTEFVLSASSMLCKNRRSQTAIKPSFFLGTLDCLSASQQQAAVKCDVAQMVCRPIARRLSSPRTTYAYG